MYLRSSKSDAHVVHFIAGQKGFPTFVCVWPQMRYSYVRPSQSDVSQAKRVRKHMMFYMSPNIPFVQRKHVYRDSSCLRDMCLWLSGVCVTLSTCQSPAALSPARGGDDFAGPRPSGRCRPVKGPLGWSLAAPLCAPAWPWGLGSGHRWCRPVKGPPAP